MFHCVSLCFTVFHCVSLCYTETQFFAKTFTVLVGPTSGQDDLIVSENGKKVIPKDGENYLTMEAGDICTVIFFAKDCVSVFQYSLCFTETQYFAKNSPCYGRACYPL